MDDATKIGLLSLRRYLLAREVGSPDPDSILAHIQTVDDLLAAPVAAQEPTPTDRYVHSLHRAVERLTAALHVATWRANPDMTHADIQAEIVHITGTSAQSAPVAAQEPIMLVPSATTPGTWKDEQGRSYQLTECKAVTGMWQGAAHVAAQEPAPGARQPDDAAMLDWLEQSTRSFCGNYSGSGFRMIGSSIWHGTLREAIAGAMKGEQPAPGARQPDLHPPHRDCECSGCVTFYSV